MIDYSWATLPVIMTVPVHVPPFGFGTWTGNVDVGDQQTLSYSHFNVINVNGGTGDDVLYGDIVFAGDGNDVIHGDIVSAGNGDDLIFTNGNTPVDGGAGNDTVSYLNSPGSSGEEVAGDVYHGGPIVDLAAHTVILDNESQILGIENVIGSQWDDRITGDDGNNRLDGDDGADHLNGGAGNDTILGGADNDWISGGLGDDVLDGGDGVDRIDLSSAVNEVIVKLAAGISRGEGTDVLHNIEDVWGSGFNDVIVGDAAANGLSGGDGVDNLQGGGGNDYLSGDGGADVLYGGDGSDKLLGWDQNDRLDGGSGNDMLYGWDGNDTMVGGTGNDWLEGGVDRDFMTGGSGTDRFVFRNGDFNGHTTGTADVIRDFNQSEHDIIRLGYVDADTRTAGDQNFTFIGTDPFHKVAGELHYQQINGNTYLSGDRNGDGLADFMIRLDGIHDLVASDFVL